MGRGTSVHCLPRAFTSTEAMMTARSSSTFTIYSACENTKSTGGRAFSAVARPNRFSNSLPGIVTCVLERSDKGGRGSAAAAPTPPQKCGLSPAAPPDGKSAAKPGHLSNAENYVPPPSTAYSARTASGPVMSFSVVAITYRPSKRFSAARRTGCSKNTKAPSRISQA